MSSYDFFKYEFICFMNSYMNSGVPRLQMGLLQNVMHIFAYFFKSLAQQTQSAHLLDPSDN